MLINGLFLFSFQTVHFYCIRNNWFLHVDFVSFHFTEIINSSSFLTSSLELSIYKNLCCCSVTSHIWIFGTSWIVAHQAPLSSVNSWSLFRLMSIELVMLSNHLVLRCPLSFCLLSFPASAYISINDYISTQNYIISR